MASYALIDKDTNIIHSLLSWRDKEIDADYPIDDNLYVLQLSDDIHLESQNEFVNGDKIKLINKDANVYSEMFERVGKSLEEIKNLKLTELNKKCNNAIIGKFSYTYTDGKEYLFSCDTEAQSNFEKVDRAFEKGRMTQIGWTAYDTNGNVYRLAFTPETFETLYVAHLNHIQGNISKLRDVLEPQIEVATIDELPNIVW